MMNKVLSTRERTWRLVFSARQGPVSIAMNTPSPESGAPDWVPAIAGDAGLPGASAAGAEGFRSAFGFPLQLGAEVTGVLGIFSRNIRQPDGDYARHVVRLPALGATN